MKKIVFVLCMLAITACTKSENNKPTVSNDIPFHDVEVDVSKLSSSNFDLNEINTTIMGEIVLDTSSNSEVSKTVLVKNSSNDSKSLVVNVDGEGYSIKVNRCPSNLNAKASCQVVVSFNPRLLYTGQHPGTLSLTDTPTDLVLNLMANIVGKDDPNNQSPVISATLSNGFYSAAVASSPITRQIKVSNAGPGNMSSVSFSLSSRYIISVNRCGALRVGESCSITVFYKDSRHSSPPNDPVDTISIAANNGNTVVIALAGGGSVVVQPPAAARLAFSGCYTEQGSVGDNSHVCKGNSMEMTVNWTAQELAAGSALQALFEGPCAVITSSMNTTYMNSSPNGAQNSVRFDNAGPLIGQEFSRQFSYVLYKPAQNFQVVDEVVACVDLGYVTLDTSTPILNSLHVNNMMIATTQNYFWGSSFQLDFSSSDMGSGFSKATVDFKDQSGSIVGSGESTSDNGTVFTTVNPSFDSTQNKTYSAYLSVYDQAGNHADGSLLVINYYGAKPTIDNVSVVGGGNGRVNCDGGAVTVSGSNFFSVDGRYTKISLVDTMGVDHECPTSNVHDEHSISCDGNVNYLMPPDEEVWHVRLTNPLTNEYTDGGTFHIGC